MDQDRESSVAVELWEQLQEIIDSGNAEHLSNFLQLLPPEDTAYTITQLDEERQTDMLSMLSGTNPDLAADLMEHFVDEYAADMIEELEPQIAAAIIDEMDSDEQVDVLAELDEDDAQAILDKMDPEEAADTRQRMRYEEDTAGGLMITEYLAYDEVQDVDDVIRDLRENSKEYIEYEVRFLYVLDSEKKLSGVVLMRELVLAPRGRNLTDLMSPAPITVKLDTPLDDLEDLFDRVDFSALPVLDDLGVLHGVVTRDVVQEARGERSSETILKIGGIINGEELRSMPLSERSLRRLAFLMPILILLMISASIIAVFESTVGKLPIIAMFLPVVAGLCGSGGNQAVAVSIREISLGLIKPTDIPGVLVKEASVALANGLILGTVLIFITWLWKGNIYLGLVVGGAIPVTIVVAGCIGGGVPLILRKFNMDPAMASGPIMTTLVDLFGFMVVLLFATLMLARLLPA